ncbi:chitin synthase chs-2-like [Mercenaria mercenaria]|uniref:chitin synthase chs-2-like n=1 Tax=Mercenaria mercenaria TaxID=6596 RepID=UPI00234F444B|nr:chitin synthase chs-2-like [Mercenaria mercenaria]
MAAKNSEAQDEEITQQYEDSTWQNEDSTQQNEDTKLTIESMSEIERKQHEKMSNKDRHKPSTFAVVIKWLFTIIFGILLLACLTVSKTSILALSEAMGNHPDLDISSRCRLFVKLQILTLVPNIINLLKSLWAGAFRKDFPMPSGKTILCAIPISLLESVGMCIFIFNIPSIIMTNHNVLLMNCVFIVPLCDNIIRSCRKRTETNEFRWTVTFVIALLLEAIGVGFSIYLVSRDSKTGRKIWMPIVGIFALSFAWTPSVHRYLLGSEITQSEPPYVNKKDGYSHANQNNSRNDKWKLGLLNPNGINKERVTWKLTIIMSALKIVSTFGTSMLIFNVEYISPFPVNSNVSIGDYDYSSGWTFWDDSMHQELYYFGVHICSSLISYYIGYIACSTCMQIGAFALPLVSTMIPSLVLLTVPETCEALLLNTNRTNGTHYPICSTQSSLDEQVVLIVAGSCLLIAQVMFSLRQIWENGSLIKLKAEQLFWLPVYTPALLEQWLMLIRRSEFGDKEYHKRVIKTNHAKVIICTTMYREDAHEMKQLLESIRSVVQTKKEKHFESHIIFDDAVKCNEPTEYALQLLYLVEDVLGVRVNNAECTKTETPYGKSLKWTLYKDNVKNDENKMDLTIHLKDNTKVKNKKRWSQVMYMSYVLDVLLKELKATDEDVFILTTDADVKFTPDSIAYLLDLMARDDTVGAVCARTYPLGHGPIVWYQAFEYAIGHWFQKAAEHVIGSVLCSPGCFSVYRCKALREILPAYASDVEHAFDFLTKDMGEDRWLCTLMVQTGRRIEYCAASENSTHCPESFDEFFKQRRRWVVSTLANMLLLLQEWSKGLVFEILSCIRIIFSVILKLLDINEEI